MEIRLNPIALKSLRWITVAAALNLMACNPQTTTVSATADAGLAESKGGAIEWFRGSVDDAFASAREQGKPVYLYWGAAWCPPCHAIAATVFRSPEFIERSRLFVPVYLDGDQPAAQAAGERFDVVGYPTMVVFSASGTELTRIPGGIDIEAYATVLDLALASTGTIRTLLDEFLDKETPLDAADCKRLTYYSWGQDQQIMAGRNAFETFHKIYAACPAALVTERSILFSNYLEQLADAVIAEPPEVTLEQNQRDEAIDSYSAILDDPSLARANVFTLIFSGSKIIAAISDPGTSTRDGLVGKARAALDRIAADDSVYKRERIYTAIGKIDLERIDNQDASLSQQLRNEIVALASWADESTPDVYERQPIINAAAGLLEHAGMPDIARPMLVAELDRSKQPYYFMLSLADIEQTEGHYAEALEWLRKAYAESRGPATRFQWGTYYVTGLLDMTPDDAQLIRKTTLSVIEELENGAGFHQRPKAQLKQLETKLRRWSNETGHAESLQEIRNDVLKVCDRVADQRASGSTCRLFLDSV